jgi:hypothetical protein
MFQTKRIKTRSRSGYRSRSMAIIFTVAIGSKK